MKVVILAGGLGSRISEESHLKPKPMIEIGGRPILWHILKIYSSYGFNEFVICLGHKGHVIKEYFSNYFLHCSDVTFDFTQKNHQQIHAHQAEPWKITLVNTGELTMTGGRIKRIRPYINEGEDFMVTYGDGLADVDIPSLLAAHKKHGKMATVTAVQPKGRFGKLVIGENEQIQGFTEKPLGDGGWINGGFFVFSDKVFNYIKEDSTVLEQAPLEMLAKDKQLYSYKHNGFWQCMDTMRDKLYLEELVEKGNPPWVQKTLQVPAKEIWV